MLRSNKKKKRQIECEELLRKEKRKERENIIPCCMDMGLPHPNSPISIVYSRSEKGPEVEYEDYKGTKWFLHLK